MGLLTSRVLKCRESSPVEPQPEEVTAGPSCLSGSRKRKLSTSENLAPSSDIHGPQNQGMSLHKVLNYIYRKRAKISSNYAYENLFLNGNDSDIKIRARRRTWCLHKVFLCQSGYFANVLKGTWKESHNIVIKLVIKNEDIDARSLHFVFGSLYTDEDLSLTPVEVPHVLAAACLLQVDRVIWQCEETMKTTINRNTVCSYYMAAETYRLKVVKTRCFEWLLYNLMIHPSVALYREVDMKLMYLLGSSSDLLVLQKEIDVYTTLKTWMFLHLNPCWNGTMIQLLDHTNSWLSNYMECIDDNSFLESEEGLIFQPVFKKLRFQHIICDLASTSILEQDRLIPLEWLSPIYKQQWLTLMQAQEYGAIGPQAINEEELEECTMRCGKIIPKDGRYTWKWLACRFGFPLRVTFNNHCVIFRQRCQECDGSACKNHIRNVLYRITLVCFDSNEKVTFRKTTGYKILPFEYNEEQIVMKLDSEVLTFPLYIFGNFLFVNLANAENK
ncbi:germ cell-less protein-like 2 [Arvicanthis niloticus]|uniref:germ cell-less protein-like 2 n=1 Tax=Arvicanthis niloticus TaxID=61156 RepID=UPI001485D512|nr:germ cell-less protein-like 2 [Arvicanthis niloticus]